MAEIQVPEDLTVLSDEDLNALAVSIQEAAQTMQESASTDDAALAALEALAADYAKVQDEMSARADAEMARSERVQAALARIAGGEVAEAEGEVEPTNVAVPGLATDAPAELAVDEVVELAAGDDDEPEAADAPDEVEAPEATDEPEAVDAPEADDADEADEADPEGTDPAPADNPELAVEETVELGIPHDPAKGRVPSEPEADLADDNIEEAAVADDITPTIEPPADPVAALAVARPAALDPATTRNSGPRRSLSTLRDSGVVSANHKGEEIDRRKLAELVCAKHAQLSRISSNVSYEPIILASARTDFAADEVLGSGHEENLTVIDRVVNRGKALVASGGNCAPLTPNYDVFNVAEAMSPVEAALPTIGAPRGGVRYITPPAWTEASEGVRITTEAEDAAGYTNQDPAGTTAPKPCVHLECSAIVECEVDAVSACATFGNLQYRTFPEQVEVFLDHLAVAFAQVKEISYLDAIQAGSTAVTSTPPYGAARGSVFSLALASHAYRKRNHMPIDAVLDILVPDTMMPFLKADMVNDLHLGLNFIGADEATVAAELFSALNLNVHWYFDYSTTYGSTRALQQAQAAGGLNAWPSLFRTYMYAPGTWVRLDGGTLDVGIVRDSTLNSQNDLQMFSEEWTQVCKVGIESVRLDLTLCPDGSGPAPITALVCAS